MTKSERLPDVFIAPSVLIELGIIAESYIDLHPEFRGKHEQVAANFRSRYEALVRKHDTLPSDDGISPNDVSVDRAFYGVSIAFRSKQEESKLRCLDIARIIADALQTCAGAAGLR